MVLRQFSLGKGIEIRQFWSRIRYNLPEKLLGYLIYSRTGFFTPDSIIEIETWK